MQISAPTVFRFALVTASVALLSACGGGASKYAGVEPDRLYEIAETEFGEGNHGNAIEAQPSSTARAIALRVESRIARSDDRPKALMPARRGSGPPWIQGRVSTLT